MAWQTLKVGGGGYVTGISIANDGTMVARTDENGAYLWTGSQWQQLVTASSMPASFDFSGDGVYEIQVAASNSNVMYMTFGGYVFKSTNKGTTWTQTSFTPFNNTNDPANDNYRFSGQKMAIDPNNPNIVYVGTPSNGLYVSTNGGQTWNSVSAIPDAAGEGITGILFDPAVGGVVNGATQTIFASSYGHGVYESTNGGATWTAGSGGPTDVVAAAVSSTGVYYASDGSNLWAYAGGAWKEVLSSSAFSSQGIQAVAVNPANPNEIVVVAPSGYLDISYDAGATWTGPMWSSNQVTSADIPWLADANTATQGAGNVFMSVGGATFNPANPSQMILTGGTGVWTTTQVPTSGANSSTPVTWTDQTAGIEDLVADGIIVPPGGDPILASYDRAFFEITNPNAYPSTYGPIDSDTLIAGFSVDYASSDPSFIVGLAEWTSDHSGYSTNGGQTWTQFPTKIPGAATAFLGGTIAASTPQDVIWAPADGNQPYYTLNGGSTWNPITLPGVSSWSNFDWAWYLVQRSVTADRVLANTFYLYYSGQGVFSTTNGGQTWTNVHSGSIGPDDGFNSSIQSVPGEAGNLFFTGGPVGTMSSTPADEPFYRSTDGGATWTAIPNVLDVFSFGFGAAAPGQSYPAIYIAGYVNSVYGIWQSTDNAQSWTNIGGANMPNGLDWIDAISGDPNHFGQVYVGFHGGGYAYLPAGSTTTTTGGGPGSATSTNPPSDFNGDGDSDILWQNTNGQAAIWEMNGTNVIADPLVGANPGPSWQAIGTGDFTDDGRSDILWQNASTGQASIWEMNGTNVIGGGLVGTAPGPDWKVVGTGDFNDDGHSDILWQNTSTGQASIWELNGTNVIGDATGGRRSWAKLESDRNRRLQRRRPFRHPVAEHEHRPSLDLGIERDECNRQSTGGRRSWAKLESDRNRRLQRRRPFRHPVAEHERSGRDLGIERDECNRRSTGGRQSWAELESDRNGRLQWRRPFRHPVAEHEHWPSLDLGNERDECNRRWTGGRRSRAELASGRLS